MSIWRVPASGCRSADGERQPQPSGDEADAAERGDGAQPPGIGDSQDIEGPGEENDACQEAEPGTFWKRLVAGQQEEHQDVSELVKNSLVPNGGRVIAEQDGFQAMSAKGAEADGESAEQRRDSHCQCIRHDATRVYTPGGRSIQWNQLIQIEIHWIFLKQKGGWGYESAFVFCVHCVTSNRLQLKPMNIIADDRCAEYSRRGHPERPARIVRTVEKLNLQRELEITWTRPGLIEDAAILRVHSQRHLARLDQPMDFDADTPFYPGIAGYARASAAAAIESMKSARAGQTAFSLMRPPGHHATSQEVMGFCYLNNVAIALVEALATGVRRAAVFDFDVHHGNGTEEILLDWEGAALFSIHQHPCYPGTGAAKRGSNCFNFPVLPHTPRLEYRRVLSQALDGLKRFEPELVAVSAGFDAYARDPLAEETLEAEDFHWLGQSIANLGVPVFNVLEGGYSHDLPELILAYLKGLSGL